MNSILITGGSGKVGLELVKYFLRQSFQVITTTRNREKLIETIDLRTDDNNLHIIEVDFENNNAVDIVLDYFSKYNLKCHTIIHNARNVNFLKIDNGLVSKTNFHGEFQLGIYFPYELTIAIRKRDLGLQNVIFVSSMYGIVAPSPSLYDDFENQSPVSYGVVKAAQIHLTKELAVRLAPKIRVNCISLGGIEGRSSSEFLNRYKSLNPQGKMLKQQDLVDPFKFLVSDDSVNMTGQNLVIDNGWTIW